MALFLVLIYSKYAVLLGSQFYGNKAINYILHFGQAIDLTLSHWPNKALKTTHQFCFNRQMPKGKIGLQGSSDLSGFCLSLIFWPDNSIWCCQIFNVFKRLKNNFFSILSCIQLEVLSK